MAVLWNPWLCLCQSHASHGLLPASDWMWQGLFLRDRGLQWWPAVAWGLLDGLAETPLDYTPGQDASILPSSSLSVTCIGLKYLPAFLDLSPTSLMGSYPNNIRAHLILFWCLILRGPRLPPLVNHLGGIFLEGLTLEEIRKVTIKESEPLHQEAKKHSKENTKSEELGRVLAAEQLIPCSEADEMER